MSTHQTSQVTSKSMLKTNVLACAMEILGSKSGFHRGFRSSLHPVVSSLNPVNVLSTVEMDVVDP